MTDISSTTWSRFLDLEATFEWYLFDQHCLQVSDGGNKGGSSGWEFCVSVEA